MGWIVGFEPTVSSATNWRFNQLSYTHHIGFMQHICASPSFSIRSGALRGTALCCANRAPSRLRARGSSPPQTGGILCICASPSFSIRSGALRGTRTPDPLLRRQMLYPTELSAQIKCLIIIYAAGRFVKGNPKIFDGFFVATRSISGAFILRTL